MRINAILSIIFIFFLKISTLANNIEAQVFTHIENKEWDLAKKLLHKAQHHTLAKIVLSQQFLDQNYTNNNFIQIIKFINNNPHWPQIEKLKLIAEEYIDESTNKQQLIEWFSKNNPRTPNGYKFYAIAASNVIKDQSKLSYIIKTGWVHGDFCAEEEKGYLAKHSKFLTKEDHLKRINEHLWRKKIAQAQRLFKLVDSCYIPSFKATIAIIEGSSNKHASFQKINPKFYTTSLIYHYLNSIKTEPPTEKTIELLNKINNDKIHNEQWGKLQLYYAREFIDYKDFTRSYKVISRSLVTNTADLQDAEWLAGFLALRFIKNPNLALTHFQKLSKISKRPISIARSNYWLARTYTVLKNADKAKEHYLKATAHPYTFYGQLSLIELKNPRIILPTSPKIDLSHKKNIKSNELVQAARLWIKYGKPEIAHSYAHAAMAIASSPGEALFIAQVIKSNAELLYYTVDIAKAATYKGAFIKEYAYPTPYNLKKSPVEAALSYAIIRQESVFHPHCESSAGAMGLMQLIKTTACTTAKAIGVKCEAHKLKKDPNYNILLGTSHLSHLLKKRDNSYILTIASYNAAPCKVDRWIDLFGDPRKMKNLHQVIDWIELIPFSETRNYVQRVLENIQVYRAILNKNNSLRLQRDLLHSTSH